MVCRSSIVPLAATLMALVSRAAAQEVSGPITFEDLRNAAIEAKVVYAQTLRRHSDNRIINNQNHTTIQLKIGAENQIEQVHLVRILAPNGREVGQNSFQGSFELNKPRKGRFGEIIWLFDDNKLVRLQTFDTGGRRVTIGFKRSGNRLTCSIDAPFAREADNRLTSQQSAIGAGRIDLLEAKQTSSSCTVTKGG